MTAKHLQSVGRGFAVARTWLLSILTAAVCYGIGESASSQEDASGQEGEVVNAVFKARQVDFFYRASRSRLPCYEIEGRVATILQAIGVRDDMQIEVLGCDRFIAQDDPFDDAFHDAFGRRDRFADPTDRYRGRRSSREDVAHVRIQLMAPVAVTPQVMKEIERDKSRRELLARVKRDPMIAMNDPIIFPAQRQQVTLSRRTLKLEAKDCELLDQMSQTVFRELGVRVVRGGLNCDLESRMPPQVTVEALLPLGAAPPPTP
ncbi:MAG TPA: hypothetical protein VIL28_02490 [Steroidobacteraceae bacterium]